MRSFRITSRLLRRNGDGNGIPGVLRGIAGRVGRTPYVVRDGQNALVIRRQRQVAFTVGAGCTQLRRA